MDILSDFGPHTAAVLDLLEILTGGNLFQFRGTLSDRFIPVPDLAEAARIASDPSRSEFHWFEDRKTVWKSPAKQSVLNTHPQAALFRANLRALEPEIDACLRAQMSEEMFAACFDEVYEEYVELAQCFVAFGESDAVDAYILEAYRQGGWPCGATGPRPQSEAEEFGDRKIYVYWAPEE